MATDTVTPTQAQVRDGNSNLLVKAQIVFLLSSLTADNFEKNQRDIRHLCDQHGVETYLHFLRHLITAAAPRVIYTGPPLFWHLSIVFTFRLLVEETQRGARDPFLADHFCEAIDKADLEPFRHFDLIHFVDRVGLSPIERLVLGSAMLSATNRRNLVQQANSLIRVNFDEARLAIMADSTFEQGNLSRSQVTKLLSNLLRESSLDSPVLDPTYRQSLLTAIAAKYGADCVLAILQQLLPHIYLAHGMSFAQALIEFGPEWTGDLEVVRALMARFGITENNPPTDIQVLETVNRLARYEGSAMPDVQVLVTAFNSFNVPLQWDKAIQVLDRPERMGIDTTTLNLIVAILSEANRAASGFWSTWSNALYQLRLIDALLSLPSDTFSFYGLPGRTVVTADDVANASPTIKTLAQNVQSSTWNSLDLFELLVRLDESEEPGVKTQVREMLDRAVRVSAELVYMGLLQVPKPWNAVQREYSNRLLSMFLDSHPNHQLVFMRIWQIDPEYLLTAFGDHYRDNPMYITRILEVAHDLKFLGALLKVQPFALSHPKGSAPVDLLGAINYFTSLPNYHIAHDQKVMREILMNDTSAQAPSTSEFDLTAAIVTIEREAVASGGFASVYVGRYNGSQVAVKVIRVICDKLPTAQRRLRREISVWKPLEHENITPFLGVARCPELSQLEAMITPWYCNGSATEYLSRASLSYLDRLCLTIGVARGLQYLHSLEPLIVHGDLKPSNILIDDHGRPRICDFGLARIISQEVGTGLTTTTRHNSTPLYAAPEILMPCDDDGLAFEPSTASDIYSLGSLIYEILTGIMPYSNLRSHTQVLVAVIRREKPATRPSQINLKYVRLKWNLLEICWSLEPEKRPMAGDVVQALEAILELYDEETVQPSPRTTPAAGSEEVFEDLSVHNDFFGAETKEQINTTAPTIDEDFDPFQYRKQPGASQVSSIWPYYGKRFIAMYPQEPKKGLPRSPFPNAIQSDLYPPLLPAPRQILNNDTPQRLQDPRPSTLPRKGSKKAILCLDYPNCRYGASCRFLHPQRVPEGRSQTFSTQQHQTKRVARSRPRE